LGPVLLAAIVTGIGAWIGARLGASLLPGQFADIAALIGAMMCAGVAYVLGVFLFRSRLPLGKFAE